MRRHAMVMGIAAGSLVVATAVVGGAAADTVGGRSQPNPTPSGPQWTCPPRGPWRGPHGPMRGVFVDNEFDYLTQMIPHHQEAVTAAEQLRRSGRPEMRRLGETIATTQRAEIATMKAWLAQWYPGRSTAVEYRPMMRDLSKLSGDELDRTFLEEMIPHHMTAIMMSQRLLMHGDVEHEQVAEFARRVRDTQHAEMFQMQRWLAEWFGERSMPGGPGMPDGPWWSTQPPCR